MVRLFNNVNGLNKIRLLLVNYLDKWQFCILSRSINQRNRNKPYPSFFFLSVTLTGNCFLRKNGAPIIFLFVLYKHKKELLVNVIRHTYLGNEMVATQNSVFIIFVSKRLLTLQLLLLFASVFAKCEPRWSWLVG